jgi:hypothetical protein
MLTVALGGTLDTVTGWLLFEMMVAQPDVPKATVAAPTQARIRLLMMPPLVIVRPPRKEALGS